MPHARNTDVLIIGAGPVGLTVAIELARRGIDCMIVDRRETPRPGTRGCTVWQRTLEVFGLMGLPVADYLRAGTRYVHRTYHLPGFPPLTHDMTSPISPTPHPLIIGQQDTERMLRTHLSGLGVSVERGLTAYSVTQELEGVTVGIRSNSGEAFSVRAGWVVAAQGPHSSIRDLLGIPWHSKRFPGTQIIQVDARVEGSLPGDPSHCHMHLHPAGSLGTAPLPDGRLRIYAGVRDFGLEGDPPIWELEAAVRTITGADVSLADGRFNWRVRLHNSVAGTFKAGRCLLAGDSAHTVMPVTAQGMNTGIQDAFNLGWKLAAVVGGAPESILDTYALEREPVAWGLAARTARSYWGGEGPTPSWDSLYSRLQNIGAAHTGLPLAYPDSPLSVSGDGERFPDAPVHLGDRPTTVYRLLASGDWTLLAFPQEPDDESHAESAAKQLAVVQRFGQVRARVVHQLGRVGPMDLYDLDGALRRSAGAQDGGLRLIRPDGYVALRTSDVRGRHVERYLNRVFGSRAWDPIGR
ncbi:3-(3-hydroxyphenyl)propionate hydroxylase [Lentzea sp. NBRC 105346]|uniref:FAD-dependent oxidoreductase n=1 Tax=Lentzea sp. NBRC 105346 TaxID=3032205 RepID=UPI0024A47F2A|nr:FAD-dependent oxidoreductase [Lentzea sp. NBRC 105346]GLZ29847.1 3-(3-hydroxyphenyl)propionate hydroxylase [Lentzea sp. NBRC 105346]